MGERAVLYWPEGSSPAARAAVSVVYPKKKHDQIWSEVAKLIATGSQHPARPRVVRGLAGRCREPVKKTKRRPTENTCFCGCRWGQKIK